MNTKVKAVAEICFDEDGKFLWSRRWIFSGIHRKGDTFIEDYKEYLVLDSKFTHGQLGGGLVENKVRVVVDRAPPGYRKHVHD